MRKYLVFWIIFMLLTCCQDGRRRLPIISIENDTCKLGFIHKKITGLFQIKNIGNGNLVIKNAKSSCHCTNIQYPKKEIPPNGECTISFTYDPDNNYLGEVNEFIILQTNTIPTLNTLYIEGIVLK